MAKDNKQIFKKNYNSDEWNKVSKSEVIKELKEKAFEVLEKIGRVKTSTAIYVIK